MEAEMNQPTGLREQKRRTLLAKIGEVGLRLFLEKGYEETTLTEIAEQAGISRRTFFYYYASKEEILMAWEGWKVPDDLASGIFKGAASLSPAKVVQRCLLNMARERVDSRSLAVDNLMQSTEVLRARKQMTYVHVEMVIYEALVRRYPRHEASGLRLVAAISVTVWRTARDRWHQAGDNDSFESYLRKQFKSLTQAFGS